MDINAALQVLWKDTCTIMEYQAYTTDNQSTQHREVVVLEHQPCKLSFQTLQPVNQTETVGHLVQTVKLFLDNNINMKAGSKIIINRSGKVFVFKHSGEAGIFTHHQEIMLVPYEEFS